MFIAAQYFDELGNTSSLVAVVNDKQIQLKKDTFNNVKSKLKRGCTDI
jgi:hypothetical protein